MIGTSPSLSPEMAAERNRYWEESVDPVRKQVFTENMTRTPDEFLQGLVFSEQFTKAYLRNAPGFWFDPYYDAKWILEGAEPNEIAQKILSADLVSLDITASKRSYSTLNSSIFPAMHDPRVCGLPGRLPNGRDPERT
jgi:hypothetical protein